MEEQGNVVSPTTSVEEQTLETPVPKVEPFTKEQQEKVNSLIREERLRVLSKLGVNSIEEGRTKIESVKELETYKTKASEYDKIVSEKKVLEGKNAMLEVGIASDMEDIVVGYFKGKDIDLNKENLSKLLEDNAKLKSQWVEQKQVVQQQIVIGNSQPSKADTTDKGYQEFKKYTRY